MSVHASSPDVRRYPSAATIRTAARIDTAITALRDERTGCAATSAARTGKLGRDNAPCSSARITDDDCLVVSGFSSSGVFAVGAGGPKAALGANVNGAEAEPLAACMCREAIAGADDDDARSITASARRCSESGKASVSVSVPEAAGEASACRSFPASTQLQE